MDSSLRDAINKWAKAKGINPEHVFIANGWDFSKNMDDTQVIWGDQPLPLSMIVRGQIKTSIFEEAQITA